MKKKLILGLASASLVLAMSMTAFAGEWKGDSNGWWYDNGNGSYPKATWQWIDGNGDGIAESYYFESDGYLAVDTSVDGYDVNSDGQWVVNGVVQTKSVSYSSNSGLGSASGAISANGSSVFAKSGSKKGLATRDTLFSNTSVRDLGVKHIVYNFTNYETNFASNFRETKDNGVSVTAIMLNTPRNNPNPASLPVQKAGAHYYGFNVATAEGEAATRQIANQFASLYKDSIDNWIIGNEINYPEVWNYTPHTSLDNYADQYAKAFRIWYNAIKQNNPSANVYIPYDYVWNAQSPAPGYYKSKDLIRLLNDRLKDTDYGIAWHPYPQDLGDPNFEDDTQAINSEDSPIVNMKNLDVLTNYMKKAEYISPSGKVRHIILSEQGFNATNEDIQADQIAKAFDIANKNPYVEAFFLAREYDQPGEMHPVNGALQEMHFGIRDAYERGGRKRKAYDTYKNLR